MKNLVLVFFALAVLSLNTQAKPLNVSKLDEVKTEFRGNDQEDAREQLLAKIRRQSQPKVILLPIDSEWGDDIDTAATNSLTSVLVKNDINMIDRDVSVQLRDELIAIEKGGMSRGSSYDLADYAIKGQVLTITSEMLFHPEKKDAFAGMDLPDRCEVKISSSIQITLYNMNPLEMEKDFVLERNYSNTYNNLKSCKGVKDDQDRLSAIAQNIERKSYKVANLFVSEGFVIGHRSYKKRGKERHIFKVHLQKDSGNYKKGSKVKVNAKEVRTDPVLGTTEVYMNTVAEGEVIETTGDNYVWFELSKKQNPDKVYLGDSVDIQLKSGGFNLGDITKGIPGF